MIRLISLALALSLSLGLRAQSSANEAKALLQKASEEMQRAPHSKIKFRYHFINRRVEPPVEQEQEGVLYLKGDDYRLQLPGLEQLRLGLKVYNILPEDEEVQIMAYRPEDEEQGLSPSRLLKMYQKGYSYALGGSEKKEGKLIQYLILKPKASEEIDKIMVGIEKESHRLYSMKQWGTNGTETEFKVLQLDTKSPLPAGTFRFRKEDYPGFYISE